MDYKNLKGIDCSKYIEKKGKFNYLSWPYMVDMLRQHEPGATIHARVDSNGFPYFKSENGGLVETYILLNGKEVWNEWLPVMDNRNQAIKNPDSMAINKAIQRCKAKCISEYTGIGLYIYMGEDLPEDNSEKITSEQTIVLAAIIESKGYDPDPVLSKYCVKIANCKDILHFPASKFEEAKTFFDGMEPKG